MLAHKKLTYNNNIPVHTCMKIVFDEFIFFREIQARPGFDYQYHGLPPNNAFWPGALLDKLRTYLPVESLHSKPYSLYNLFQPVSHPRVYNPRVPIDNTRGAAWPVNSSGHVQLGPSLARTRKTYIL